MVKKPTYEELEQKVKEFENVAFECKRAEEKLIASEKLYKEAQLLARIGHWKYDPQEDSLTWSDELYSIFEIDKDAGPVSIEVFIERIHPEDRDAIRGQVEKGESYRSEYRIFVDNGVVKHIREEVLIVRQEDGKILIMKGTAQDITRQKQTEEALRESEEKYYTLFEDSPISLWEEDLSAVKSFINSLRDKGINNFRTYFEEHPEDLVHCVAMVKIVDINKTTIDMYQVETKKEFFKGLSQFLTEESYELFKEEILSLCAGNTSFEGETITQTATGEIKYIYMKCSLAHGFEETWSKMLVSITDVTGRKRAEEAIEQRTQDLGERVKELNCLYGISNLVEKPDISLDEIIHGVVELIPLSWRYPEITCSRVLLEGKEYKTENFKETNWKQSSEFFVHGKRMGVLEVYSLEEKPEIDDGPFFKEERDLIQAITERLGHTIERLQAEEALKESEERFKGLIEQSPVSVQMMDPDGKTFQVNRAWEELWGVTLEDLENYNFLQDEQLKSLGLMPYIEKGFSGEVSSIPPREYDAKNTLGKGIKRWVTARLFPVKDTMENIRSIVLMHEDVTARVLAEKTLRESEEKYRLLIENATDAIFIAQAEVLKFANPKAEEMTEYCAEELTKIPFVELLHPEDREMVIERHLKRLKGEELPSVYSFRILNRSGKELLVELNAVLINWEGKPATLNFMRDITVQRKLEAQLKRTQKMEAIATLAGGVAHEFNNALTGIMGNIELLKMSLPEDERRDRYFKAMNGSSHRMSRLTDQLLAYAEGGKYQPKDLRLNDFVIETLPILQYDLSPEVSVETHFPKDISHIKADYAQMQMVLSAILANSNEAIEDEGLIRITAENEDVDEDFAKQHPGLKAGPYVCLTIEDDGKGMDEETRTGIFEPFFTTKFQGRGMGMAAVYGIVRNHDGWIYVESELGKGTTVQIYLHAIEIEVEKPKKAKVEVVARSGTILMIEDEDVVIEVTQAMLEMLGYRVMVAKNGKDAIHIAKTFDGQIDLALLDIKLPDMEGGKVYPQIMEARPNLKVIVFSGYSIDGPAQKILDAGAQDFLQKPFSLAILSEKLEEVLGGNNP